eukprot:7390691-Prymnesium_polylepis.1
MSVRCSLWKYTLARKVLTKIMPSSASSGSAAGTRSCGRPPRWPAHPGGSGCANRFWAAPPRRR